MQDKAMETARQIWASMNSDERFGVQFAMFPVDKMPPAGTPEPFVRAVTYALMQIEQEARHANS